MTMLNDLMGQGCSAELAKVLINEENTSAPIRSVGSALTAAGTVITDALDLTKFINVITTTAASTGVQLPSEWPIGQMGIVQNGGANALNLFPHSASGTINGGSAGAAVSIAAAAGNLIVRQTALNWLAYVLAYED